MKSTISVTHNCNLSCSYCYAGEKCKRDLPIDTARRIVDFSFDITPCNEPIEFGFFGGEPLLKFALIKQLITYIREKQQLSTHPVNLQITTNGTLITPEILRFLKDEDFGLCVSIDGDRHIHDQERRYRNGKSSFDRILKNLHSAMRVLDKIQVNAVYGPETLASLPQTVDFFVSNGATLIHLNPNITTNWDGVDSSALNSSYNAMAERYIEYYEKGLEVAVNQLDSKIIIFFKGGYDASDRCGMGEREWGFAPSGNIYPCERFIGDDDGGEFCVGNVHTGLSQASRCAVLNKRGNINPQCAECSLQPYCMNWCGCTNQAMTGHSNIASNFLCNSEKASIAAARKVIDKLKENDLFIDHFYRYLVKDQESTDQTIHKGEKL